MNIEGMVNGFAAVETVGEDASRSRLGSPDCLRLKLPISFRHFTGSSQALVDCHAADARCDNERLFPVGRVTIRPYSSDPSREPDAIRDRPIRFRPTEPGDTNTLVLDFSLKRDQGSVLELNDRCIEVDVELVFASLHKVTLTASLKPQFEAGTLLVQAIKRAGRPQPMLRNLVLLLALCSVLVAWNFYINKDVQASEAVVADEAVWLALGSILTFLGLSFSQIRAWFGNLRNVSGLLHFPELHLDPATARVLGARRTGLVLTAGLALALAMVGFLWSIPVARIPNGYELRDVVKNDIVHKTRVYYWQARDKRFKVFCSGTGDGRPPLATLVPSSPFTTKLSSSTVILQAPGFLGPRVFERGDERLYEKAVDGMLLLTLPVEEPAQRALRGWLCGHSAPTDAVVVPTTTSGNVRARINPTALISQADLESILNKYKHSYMKTADASAVWVNRDQHVRELAMSLHDALTQRNQRVSASDVVTLATSMLAEAKQVQGAGLDHKRTVERSVLLRGLLRTHSSRGSEAFDEATALPLIDMIARQLQELSFADNHWRVVRSLWELLLELEKLSPTPCGERVHEAITKTGRGGLSAQGAEAVWQYVRAVARVYLPQSPDKIGPSCRREYFRRAETLRLLKGLESTAGLTGALTYVNEKEAIASEDWANVQRALHSLWADVYSTRSV
jgi:hypothetical protein